jgi:hypothetical protein
MSGVAPDASSSVSEETAGQEAAAQQAAARQAAAQQAWALDDNDRAVLRRLITDLRRLLGLARSNDAIIAVGEALEAVEKVRDGEGVEGDFALLVGVQDGNEAFNEGWFVRLGLAPDAIALDKLSTTYTVENGLDRHITSYAVLKPTGGFDDAGVAQWLSELNELRRWSTAEIRSERVPYWSLRLQAAIEGGTGA